MALAFRSNPTIEAVPNIPTLDTSAFEDGVSWFERRWEDGDAELPRRAAAYLVQRGLTRDEAARAIETEFELPPGVAASLADAA